MKDAYSLELPVDIKYWVSPNNISANAQIYINNFIAVDHNTTNVCDYINFNRLYTKTANHDNLIKRIAKNSKLRSAQNNASYVNLNKKRVDIANNLTMGNSFNDTTDVNVRSIKYNSLEVAEVIGILHILYPLLTNTRQE
ncbi:unnamed protein product [Gordionus sp. m RMFG-2023]